MISRKLLFSLPFVFRLPRRAEGRGENYTAYTFKWEKGARRTFALTPLSALSDDFLAVYDVDALFEG